MDASNYRRVPVGVVAPRDAEDVAAALAVCAAAGVPVVPRGGGTSIAGQATGVGVVLDLTRHMNALVSLDPAARTAVVQPGLVLDRLRDAARPHGLTFGPDPSTHSRCTLGGMIGNNACGAHSVAWGTTADNVAELAVTAYGGSSHRLGTGWQGAPDGLRELVSENLAALRTGMAGGPADGFARRISGYGDLDALLPERGTRVARAFCGSEGTLGVVTEAVVRLVELPAAPALAVLGYADESAAAQAAAGLLQYGPLTVEGMAADLVGGAAGLPRGGAWLFVEMRDEGAARALLRASDAVDGLLLTDPAAQRALWRIREDAAGTATRMPDGTMAWPGWEDCAVPPARLGAYLREFRALLAEHGLRGSPYGHFGEGCVHVRIDFDLVTAPGVARFRAFSSDLADLVVAHGGSLSGEHGDGQARAELLPRMYGPSVIGLFEAYKRVWDPAGGMNPGILVRPARLDENLRFASLPPSLPFAGEVARCVGVAKCRSTEVGGPGVMCPSYRATGEERHSTRGRARLLHEMLAGEIVTDGWRSAEVAEALDLCLGCKGCRSDCPVGVDMAAYKAEFLHHHWAGRLRPLSHYALGGLPGWLRLIAALRLAAPLNLMSRFLRIPGLERSRPLPRLARTPFTHAWRGPLPALPPFPGLRPDPSPGAAPLPGASPRTPAPQTPEGLGFRRRRGWIARRAIPAPPAFEARGLGRSPRGSGAQPRGTGEGRVGDPAPQGAPGPGPGAVVTVWPDTFTEYLAPEAGHAALRVLRAAGLEPRVQTGRVCCGLTYISTGRLDTARRVLRRTLDAVGDPQGPVTVLEPSCAAALRTDLPALLPEDPRAPRLAAAVRTFAETLEEYAPHWQPPRLDRPVAGQTHCHQHAVLGDAADRRLRERAGLTGELSGGCCGLAGNFGFEPGHHEVSVACAEEQLLPSLRAAAPGTEVLADGFSCRTQIAQLAGGRARHLAEVLAEGLPDGWPEPDVDRM
ncbi:FAD-binding and (Fe-S)-binding domain-containing protein [Streptomyces sp. ZAF1911]|uniref:FAD-binding and (Fe-S)-binding domain-containing protein n=1 Tax=Streptomyces sp. ZAF1911 TaxID=2944129 RepID=UPI00237C23FF|nr:FAD-binding and (Fe-S)-binding domain-containing protein [Streptomyces sp. ZAF1911]MDD9377120.1 FAD-binding and (Fe-S)-binding domain-containing protein [Streptomyces sp. ZAF1911]